MLFRRLTSTIMASVRVITVVHHSAADLASTNQPDKKLTPFKTTCIGIQHLTQQFQECVHRSALTRTHTQEREREKNKKKRKKKLIWFVCEWGIEQRFVLQVWESTQASKSCQLLAVVDEIISIEKVFNFWNNNRLSVESKRNEFGWTNFIKAFVVDLMEIGTHFAKLLHAASFYLRGNIPPHFINFEPAKKTLEEGGG